MRSTFLKFIFLSLAGFALSSLQTGCSNDSTTTPIGAPPTAATTPAPGISAPPGVTISAVTIDHLNNQEYELTCLPSVSASPSVSTSPGRVAAASAPLPDPSPSETNSPTLVKTVPCSAALATTKQVFTRVVKMTKDNVKVLSTIGVWASKAAFKACGGFDLFAQDYKIATAQGYSVTQGTHGSAPIPGASPSTSPSPEASPSQPETVDNRCLPQVGKSGRLASETQNQLTQLARPSPVGKGFAVTSHTDLTRPKGCRISRELSIAFAPTAKTTTTGELVGHFITSESRTGCDGHEKTFLEVDHGNFQVLFTPRH